MSSHKLLLCFVVLMTRALAAPLASTEVSDEQEEHSRREGLKPRYFHFPTQQDNEVDSEPLPSKTPPYLSVDSNQVHQNEISKHELQYGIGNESVPLSNTEMASDNIFFEDKTDIAPQGNVPDNLMELFNNHVKPIVSDVKINAGSEHEEKSIKSNIDKAVEAVKGLINLHKPAAAVAAVAATVTSDHVQEPHVEHQPIHTVTDTNSHNRPAMDSKVDILKKIKSHLKLKKQTPKPNSLSPALKAWYGHRLHTQQQLSALLEHHRHENPGQEYHSQQHGYPQEYYSQQHGYGHEYYSQQQGYPHEYPHFAPSIGEYSQWEPYTNQYPQWRQWWSPETDDYYPYYINF